MKIQLEITQNDLPVLGAVVRLIENNKEKLGKDYVRALDLLKSAKKQADSINVMQYDNKINGYTLIHDVK